MKRRTSLLAAARLVLAGAALLAGPVQAAPRAQEPARPAAAGRAPEAPAPPDPVVARGRDAVLRASELERVLVQRFAMSADGREILKLLLNSKVLERLGEERGLRVEAEEVDRLWERLDTEARASGESRGLLAEIKEKGLGVQEFRDYLRLSVLQERLTRDALGIPPERPVSGDQQEIWLSQEMVDRGLDWPAPPWPDGIAARCGEVVVRESELGQALRKRLPQDQVRETAWHVLLLRGIEERMPDLSPEARERAIDAEMDRRRAKVEAGTQGRAVSFEEIVGASGNTVAGLRRDPSVHIAALSYLWVERKAGEDGLREAYEAERAFFEGVYGKAVRTHLLFLTAARYVNELNPRTYEMADEELRRMAGEIGNTDDFAAQARKYSEDPTSRQNGGELGWVTRRDPRLPRAIPDAVFAHLDAGKEVPPGGCAVGPVRLESGSGLLWISAVRESPSWEVMSRHVHEELRRRFLSDVLHPDDVELVSP